MSWIPVPQETLSGGSRRLGEGYMACPETGEIRSPRGEVLRRKAAGPKSTAVHVWGAAPGGKRKRTSASDARLVALALLALGWVEPPRAGTHARRATLVDAREPPRLHNLAWQGLGGRAAQPLVVTPAGREGLGAGRPR